MGGPKWLTPDTSLTFDDKEMTKWFLARGADPNAECALDLTPLSIAVLNSPFHIIELLFHHGGSIERGQLLHYAVRRDASDRLRVLEYICDKCSPIDHVMYQTRLACHEHQKALGIGSPLHGTAGLGRLDVVESLLAKGADPWIKDTRGQSTVESAERHGYTAVARRLRSACIPSSTHTTIVRGDVELQVANRLKRN
jgi:ankyrin repeat protein